MPGDNDDKHGEENQCQQLLSDIRTTLGVPEMTAEERADALKRCGTKSAQEICAEMIEMLAAPLASEVSDNGHSKEERSVDGEEAAPAATKPSEMNMVEANEGPSEPSE